MIATDGQYAELFDSICATSLTMARCACVSCNSCTCACSCRYAPGFDDETDIFKW